MKELKEIIREKIDNLIDNNINDFVFLELLNNQLSTIEETILNKKKVIEDREIRKQELEDLKSEFIEDFLEECNYYYIPDIDRFLVYKTAYNSNEYELDEVSSLSDEEYIYDNTTKDIDVNNELYSFELINENKIWINISKKIREYDSLVSWKHKVRNELISKLKKRNLLINSIPESSTIQRVLSIFSSTITTNKELSKYLLTILGDAIFKKQTTDIYFVNTNLYKALNVLQYNINKYIKCIFLSNFKTKYHNQSYDNIRYIKSNDNIDKSYIWEQLFKKHIFDIIAVSCHYSGRFQNAETFLNEHFVSINELKNILYTKGKTKEIVIEEFVKEYLESNDVLTIKVKEVNYLWKEYLVEKDLPNTIYLNDLTSYLDKNYEVKDNIYQKLTSPKLKYIKNILDFVNDEIIILKEKDLEIDDKDTICENETIFTGKFNLLKFIEPDNYEIGEIYQVFQYWKSMNNISININEDILLNVLKHFCDNILIEDNKYFYGIQCKSWDKKNCIKEFLERKQMKEFRYSKYCKWCKDNNKRFIVSKSYFDFMKKNI
jgi:hypothetical protein